MGCEEQRRQLACYRALSGAEQHQLQQHLAGCSTCRATWEVYQAQDRALTNLPSIRPSAGFAQAVFARTTRVPLLAPRRMPAWVFSAAAIFLVAMLIINSTLTVAAQSLPGDALYSFKLVSEQVRLLVTVDHDARLRYVAELAETRRRETTQVIDQGREVSVTFEGKVIAADGCWVVAGITVTDASGVQLPAVPPEGELAVVVGKVSNGVVVANLVGYKPRPPAPNSPVTMPTATTTSLPTATVTASPLPKDTPAPTNTLVPATRAVLGATETAQTVIPRVRTPESTGTPREHKPTHTAVPVQPTRVLSRTPKLTATLRPIVPTDPINPG